LHYRSDTDYLAILIEHLGNSSPFFVYRIGGTADPEQGNRAPATHRPRRKEWAGGMQCG
jgi:hypothetical protein